LNCVTRVYGPEVTREGVGQEILYHQGEAEGHHDAERDSFTALRHTRKEISVDEDADKEKERPRNHGGQKRIKARSREKVPSHVC